jgi:hypothetical protein
LISERLGEEMKFVAGHAHRKLPGQPLENGFGQRGYG